jgi:anti-sigma B factor antagonist
MKTKKPQRLAITEPMSIYQAPELKARILETLGAAEAVELDLSQVGEIDSAGLQLLMLAKREALAAGKTLQIVSHSPAVREVIEFANLAGHFGDPLVISAR